MANQEQLEILKQGVEVWNKWRENNSDVGIDLRETVLDDASLREADLRGVNLAGANLLHVDFWRANLREADLTVADLRQADLTEADLRRADLRNARLIAANLQQANLQQANLQQADLEQADLTKADLKEADLRLALIRFADLTGANLKGAHLNVALFMDAYLRETDLTEAILGETVFREIDLSDTIGLEDIRHLGPSTIGIDTIRKSKGKIPVEFLRGCGLSDVEVEYAKLYDPDLSSNEIDTILYKLHDLRVGQAIQISPLFISYSHADSLFVDKIGDYLIEKGVRFWRDIHDAKAGRLEKQIDLAIRQNPTVLLVLSNHSLSSNWVEHEVRTARELEKELGRDTLCPVALDDSWKDSPWPKRVMEQVMEYNILDFSEWEEDVKFEGMFRRLIDGLELFYKG